MDGLKWTIRLGIAQCVLALVVGLTVMAIACNSSGTPSLPPHDSWKERGEYCYTIVVDPRGNSNTLIGYADDAKLVVTDAGFVVEAIDVRVDPDTYGEKDYYSPYVTWTTDGDGFADIQGCAPTSIEVR